MNDFFRYENQAFPAALNDLGRLHSCQKSQLTSILEDKVTNADKIPKAEAIMIDGSALIISLIPRISKTFDEYALLEVIPKVQTYITKYSRTDIVFDVYKPSSLKAETRSKRGFGARQLVTGNVNIPKNWQSFNERRHQ